MDDDYKRFCLNCSWKGTAESFYNEMKFVYENVYLFYIDTDGLRVILW